MKIIFAQGNPEPDYKNTRHNVGFEVLNNLAKQLDVSWQDKSKYNAFVAESEISGEKVWLVKPYTFYNETGSSAQKIVSFLKLNFEKDLLVIHDDLALPFGTIRFREKGRDAGNNGIKSIINHLDQKFARVRIGIHNDLRSFKDDSDFVVDKFSSSEQKTLEESIIPKTIEIIDHFCQEKTTHISYKTTQ